MKTLLLMLSLLFALSGTALARMNVNTATQAELETLPEVGPVKAKAIIDYRKKNGPFKSIEDLQKVNGVGPVTTKAIKDQIGFSGPSTPVAGGKKETLEAVKAKVAPKPIIPSVPKPVGAAPGANAKPMAGNAAGASKAKDKPVDAVDSGKGNDKAVSNKLKEAPVLKNSNIGTGKEKPK